MAKKIATLVVCIFLVAAIFVHKAEASGGYAQCFSKCDKECQYQGLGRAFCEMRCEADCMAKETKAKIDDLYNPQP